MNRMEKSWGDRFADLEKKLDDVKKTLDDFQSKTHVSKIVWISKLIYNMIHRCELEYKKRETLNKPLSSVVKACLTMAEKKMMHGALSWLLLRYIKHSSTIKRHLASSRASSVIKHHQVLSSIIKHHQVSSSIIKHHQVLLSVIKHHQCFAAISNKAFWPPPPWAS